MKSGVSSCRMSLILILILISAREAGVGMPPALAGD